ncbi:MAG: TIGR00266 family protein [Saprospiraceae bacterium]|nr:TIGR00266 family protein [Saprospiraceae bacterium]MDW8485250.1 TIGR00266 family protein [Saprospiraceae bacterium]
MPFAHEVDFRIYGEEMQCVEIELDPQEAVIAETGSFMFMEDGIEMDTVVGDGREQGLWGKLLSVGKRVLTGESLFLAAFTNVSTGKRRITFAAPYAGKIVPFNLAQVGGQIICQKDAFLCAAKGVSLDIALQRRLGTGLFGGEGFIMQKLEGDGLAFLHAGGHVLERTLGVGEVLRIDTGCVVAYTREIDFDIQMVRGIKNMLFGGEGFFYAVLRGPGRVWLQSLPVSRLASRILQYGHGARREEGSILGGLGNLLDGD